VDHEQRLDNYQRTNGTRKLTVRQARQLRRKLRRVWHADEIEARKVARNLVRRITAQEDTP
jgi:hypothetical protein